MPTRNALVARTTFSFTLINVIFESNELYTQKSHTAKMKAVQKRNRITNIQPQIQNYSESVEQDQHLNVMRPVFKQSRSP